MDFSTGQDGKFARKDASPGGGGRSAAMTGQAGSFQVVSQAFERVGEQFVRRLDRSQDTARAQTVSGQQGALFKVITGALFVIRGVAGVLQSAQR